MLILTEDMQRIVQYISLHPDRFPNSSKCRTLTQTDVTRGRPLPCHELFLLYFGVREDAVATVKEGLNRFEILSVPAVSCMEGGNLTHESMIFCTVIYVFTAKMISLSVTLKNISRSYL